MILDLGFVEYRKALALQKEFVARRRLGEIEDSCFMAEHPAVFTIGRTGKRENLLVSESELSIAGIEVIGVDRGGDITFHGPGQLLIYPIIDLKGKARDLHRYLRDLEELGLRILSGYAIRGQRIKEKTGIWVGKAKIASIGVAARDWVTYHGISINVNIDLRYFSMIHPCGMKGIEVTSLGVLLSRNVAMREVKERALEHLKDVFGLKPDTHVQTAGLA